MFFCGQFWDFFPLSLVLGLNLVVLIFTIYLFVHLLRREQRRMSEIEEYAFGVFDQIMQFTIPNSLVGHLKRVDKNEAEIACSTAYM